MGVCVLRFVVDFVALVVFGMVFFDDVYFGVDRVEFGVRYVVCVGYGLVVYIFCVVVFFRFIVVFLKSIRDIKIVMDI